MELRLPAPSLVVLVGPSGAGKSTWAAEHFASNEIVSSDALRATVGAGEDDQAAGKIAFEILEIVVAERLRRGLTTVIDTLGFDDEARVRWVEGAHEAGVPAHAVVFDTPAAVCAERNAQRSRPIPKSVLNKQMSRFDQVSKRVAGEPFDGIHTPEPMAVVSPVVARASVAETADAPPEGHSFGLMVSRFDWDRGDLGEQLVSIATRAEGAGFTDMWLMDHFRQIPSVGRAWEDIPEAYTALAYVAGATEKIRLGAMVTGITHRHPVVLGKMVATLDVLSGGRAICGLGAAWDQKEHAAYGIEFPPIGTRYEILEETLQMLPLLWGKGTPEYHGRHIDADELVCYPRPTQDRIPIVVGGSGERRTLRFVAEYADACNLVTADPQTIAAKVEVLHGHCADVDRDPTTVDVTHLTSVLAAPDRQGVRERVESLRGRNTTVEEYMSRINAGTTADLVGLFAACHAAGATHSIVSMPDVSRVGSIESFSQVIDEIARP